MEERTPRTTMRDDPRLPPLTLGDEPIKPIRRPPERPERRAGAADAIQRVDGDLAELRNQCARQDAEIARQQSYIHFLENQCRLIDQERLKYMRVAVGLAKQIKSVARLCEEGVAIAEAAEHLKEEP
jgi:hypothetical protein